jgi:hypothetical protein
MTKLNRRYSKCELEILLASIKPFEEWSQSERAGWLRQQVGFRHFIAPNITPIEHYQPKPPPAYSPATHPHHTKPAA